VVAGTYQDRAVSGASLTWACEARELAAHEPDKSFIVEIVRDEQIEQWHAPVALLDEGDGAPFDQPPLGRTTPTTNWS
jgi:hypothetical protein